MVQPPKPTKTQQAVATNKAAQEQRQQRVAETTKKITAIQNKTKSAPKSTPKSDTTSAAAIAEAERLRREAEAEAERLRNRIVIDDTEERINLYQAMDKMREKYGDRAVVSAAGMIAKSIGRWNPFNGEAPPLLANRRQ